MGKLHEVLAVETNLETVARDISDEAKSVFAKLNRFSGISKILEMFDESRRDEDIVTEQVEVSITVDEKLNYIRQPLGRWWDAVYQKELANTDAKADVEVDGKVIIEDAPVPFLLNLEKRLNEFRDVLSTIPTLKPGVIWLPDESQKRGVFVSTNSTPRFKTEKIIDIIIATDATPQHKAQYEKISKDKPIGKYQEKEYSGAISSARKSEMLERTDKMVIAVKQARMRANCSEVPSETCSPAIFDYILGT